MQLGPAEILVVLVIALLIFGPNKLPEVGRQVGRAYREVRRFQRSLSSEMSEVFADDVSDAATPAPTLPPKAAVPADPDDDMPDGNAPDEHKPVADATDEHEPVDADPAVGPADQA